MGNFIAGCIGFVIGTITVIVWALCAANKSRNEDE